MSKTEGARHGRGGQARPLAMVAGRETRISHYNPIREIVEVLREPGYAALLAVIGAMFASVYVIAAVVG